MISKLLFIFRRRWPILLGVPLLSLVTVFLLSPTPKKEPTRYRATVFIAADPNVIGQVQLSQAALEIRQGEVATKAAELLGDEETNPIKLGSTIKTEVKDSSMSVSLSTIATDPDVAEERVSAFAEAFIDVTSGRISGSTESLREEAVAARDAALLQLTTYTRDNGEKLTRVPPDPNATLQVRILQNALDTAEQRLIELAATEQVDLPYRIAAEVPASQLAASKLQLPQSRAVRSIVTLFFSIVGAILLALLIERLNPRIDSTEDAEAIIDAPTLGMVPIMSGKRHKILERADLSLFSGPFAESFRAVRAHLDFRSAAEDRGRPPCVMIVSSAPGEGKTTTAAFLGLAYAEAGRDVLVVGADFRRPAVHRLFGVPRSPGLSTRLLANEAESRTEQVVRSIVKRDERTGVRVIPSGPGTDRVTGLLGDLSAVTAAGLESDCTVVIDTAPVMVANDAIDFLPLVDWVIVVVRLGRTTERSLRQTIATLELNDARIAGAVVMGSLESSDAKRYYYSYYKVDDDDGLASHEARAASSFAGAPGATREGAPSDRSV